MKSGFWGLVVSILAIAVSIAALVISYQANTMVKEGNKIAMEANRIAEDADRNANRPILREPTLVFDPSDVGVFGGAKIHLVGKKALTEEQLKVIRNTHRSNAKVSLSVEPNGEKRDYMLINLCKERTLDEEIGLIVNALVLEFENEGEQIIELTINEGYSMTSPEESFPTDLHIGESNYVFNGANRMRVAYAYGVDDVSSLYLGDIAKLIAAGEQKINLRESPEMAADILSFVETGYQFSCKTESGHDYDYSLVIKRDMDDGGKLEYCRINYTRDLFDRMASKASKRVEKATKEVKKDVVIKKEATPSV